MINTRKTAMLGILLAAICVLTFIEHQLPPIPFLPPNVKLGLANIITMYAVFFIGSKEAVLLTVLKSAFVFSTRGAMAGALSLSGGMASILILILLNKVFKEKLSYTAAGITGALAHNIGQIAAASVFTSTGLILFYLPALIVSAIICGTVTGTLLSSIMPLFRLRGNINEKD